MKAKILSKNLNRTTEEDNELYSYIEEYVLKAKNSDTSALEQLFSIFNPLVMRWCKYCSLYEVYSYDELYNESYIIINDIIQKYDETKSVFGYYLKFMYPRLIKNYCTAENKRRQRVMVSLVINSEARDPRFKDKCDFEDYCTHRDSVINEMTHIDVLQAVCTAIETVKGRKNKSPNTSSVIQAYFINRDSIQLISERLSVSYHAVHETVRRAKFRLACLLQQDPRIYYNIDVDTTNQNSLGKYNSIVYKIT